MNLYELSTLVYIRIGMYFTYLGICLAMNIFGF